ncbi:hypothetical protein GCM10010991_32750 [Gemmobacter aquaticus]|uniref:DUF1127 domain-containing protein n=2 Tax=Gemmobacter aquaticus TaxID=490185 RepID=A0A917YPW1_9RHOB|nr:hypothetical protein GCM10010991_32750 [Gemmobacter aquaticus]
MEKELKMASQLLTAPTLTASKGAWPLMDSFAGFLARRQSARDLGRLEPRLLRDVGLPEDLAHLAPADLWAWLKEEGL